MLLSATMYHLHHKWDNAFFILQMIKCFSYIINATKSLLYYKGDNASRISPMRQCLSYIADALWMAMTQDSRLKCRQTKQKSEI